jgi:hypothetical protein
MAAQVTPNLFSAMSKAEEVLQEALSQELSMPSL